MPPHQAWRPRQAGPSGAARTDMAGRARLRARKQGQASWLFGSGGAHGRPGGCLWAAACKAAAPAPPALPPAARCACWATHLEADPHFLRARDQPGQQPLELPLSSRQLSMERLAGQARGRRLEGCAASARSRAVALHSMAGSRRGEGGGARAPPSIPCLAGLPGGAACRPVLQLLLRRAAGEQRQRGQLPSSFELRLVRKRLQPCGIRMLRMLRCAHRRRSGGRLARLAPARLWLPSAVGHVGRARFSACAGSAAGGAAG